MKTRWRQKNVFVDGSDFQISVALSWTQGNEKEPLILGSKWRPLVGKIVNATFIHSSYHNRLRNYDNNVRVIMGPHGVRVGGPHAL